MNGTNQRHYNDFFTPSGDIAYFYFLIIRPQRQQQKKHREMIEGLTKGDKIVTQGGLIVEVLKAEATFFSVKLNDDTTAKLSKNYIAFKLDEEVAPNNN